MPAKLLRLFSLLPVFRIEQKTKAKASEDSLLFRVLVQAMVSIGIMATDVAAETQMSWWAVPLSIVGATWSWRQRQRPQIALKFGLAAALLVALFSFFQHLLGSLNDTRLVLAELLVQVQAIHTFDMPRRKDLGYSIIIGVILVAVAATIGQTMAFAPMLLLFLCLALPVMVLDYRSRLGMAPAGLPGRGASAGSFPVPFGNLAKLLATILLLGLLVFGLMPRLPSYQIQSMPMSGEMPATNFNGSTIANPGYQNKGKGKGGKSIDGKSAGGSGSTEDSEFDDSSYYGFNQQMDQNLRGQLKPKLVLRVRSQSPGFWRVLAFDRYTGHGWEISQNEHTKTIEREAWSSKFTVPKPLSRAPFKKIIQSYTAVSELPNVLPALTTPTEIYFPSQRMAVDREGSLRSAAGLSPGFTYTVASEVAERDATILGKAGFKYESDFRSVMADYLQVPPALAKKLRSFTDKIIADYPKAQITKDAEPLNNNYDVALYLAQYLKQNYEVPKNSSDLPPMPQGKDLVDWFLGDCPNKTCGGYPDHFATVHTMMLRSVGIPARLAVGFEPGYFNPFTGMYEVKNTDAHALTEVYFPKYGWYSFDPLPGHPLFPPSVEEDQTFGVVKQLWNWVAGLLPSPVTAWIGTIVGAVFGWLVALWLFMTNSWLGAIFGLAMAISVVFGAWLLWQQWRRWRYDRWLRQQPPMERLYLQMLASLSRWSIAPKVPSQTPFEHWQEIYDPVAVREGIEPIVLAYVAWKYGDRPPQLDYLQSILRSLQKARV
jgi:transglutaminase-like putative cysteine protease